MKEVEVAIMSTHVLTAEHLAGIGDGRHRFELADGRLIVREPAGFLHGLVTSRLATRLARHVEAHDLGVVLGADTGYLLGRGPDTVRAPDVSFVSRERIPDPLPSSFAELAPDLAAEIVSPSNAGVGIEARVRDLLDAGTRLIWVLDPEARTLSAHRPGRAPEHAGEQALLDGGDVVPGFRCCLADLLRSARGR